MLRDNISWVHYNHKQTLSARQRYVRPTAGGGHVLVRSTGEIAATPGARRFDVPS